MKKNKMNWLFFLAFFLMNIATQAQQAVSEQLLVFVDSKNQILTDEDKNTLEELAKENKVSFLLVDIQKGAPEAITYTPTIVFQNYSGRSYYYGRYKNSTRLQNFIRTSRLAHQKNTNNSKKGLLWQKQKSQIAAPLKITPLDGTIPKGFDAITFNQEVNKAVSKGMQFFEAKESYNSTRSTRSFYINLYPYIDSKKNLTIAAELFSQYNCVKPVFQKYDTGLVKGKWKNRLALFEKAGQVMEQEILRQIQDSEIGDSFEAISLDIPSKSWAKLDLSLPSKPIPRRIAAIKEMEFAQNWTIAPSENKNEPLVIFSFLPPLDSYAGEVKALSGTLDLEKENVLLGASGFFEVAIENVTMGSEDFDFEVQNKMLQKANFPTSSFTFKLTKAPSEPLELGKIVAVEAVGQFNLLGKTINLTVPATIEPFLNQKGDIRLQVNTNFELALFDHFQVEGPDGPSPSKDTLQFFMKFYLQSK